mgnify:CR=1 FL=1
MKKFLMLLVAGTLVLSIAGCKKEATEDKVDDLKKAGEKVADDAAKKVEDAKE